MSLKKNIIYIYFKGKHLITSKSQYQYNHGQYLYFADLNLPQAFEVHFSNKERGESKTQIGSNKLVEIPDKFFWSGALQIYAWVYLHDGTDDGETIYEVRIPLIKRAKPIDEEPLPAQQLAIDKAIAELNNAVDITNENADKTNADKIQVATIKEEVVVLKEEINTTASTVNQDVQTAQTAAERSEQSAQNSAESERKALDYSDEAKGYAQSAFESKDTASQKAQVATDAAAEAKGYRDEAETFKNEAKLAKQNIVDYRDETKGYRDEALTAKNDAQDSANAAQETLEQVTQAGEEIIESVRDLGSRYATQAETAANNAQASAESASSKASEASQSASQASGYAQTAETAKTDAQTAKTQAETARDNAVTAKTAAETAQGKAETAQAATESVAESIPSDYSQLSEDVTELKSGLTNLGDPPKIVEPEETEADLYICDAQGNVIGEFINGHIRTKNFNSANTIDTDLTDALPNVFDVTDSGGNVLIRFKDGHIQTKEFNSSVVADAVSNIGVKGEKSLSLFNIFSNCYVYHHMNVEASNPYIPSESLYDIRYAKSLGFDMIEANTQKCADGVFVVKHGANSGSLGAGIKDAIGSADYSGVKWSEVTSTWLRENVRYNARLPKFCGFIPTLDEFCEECRRFNMKVKVSSIEAAMVARKYLPDEMIWATMWTPSEGRGEFRGTVEYVWYKNSSIDTAIDQAKTIGAPLNIVVSGRLASRNEADVAEMVKKAHDNGFTVGVVYPDPSEIMTAVRLGVDCVGSTFKTVNLFDDGMAIRIVNLEDNAITFSSGASYDSTTDTINMEAGSSIHAAGNFVCGKGCIVLRYSGELTITVGATNSENELQNCVSDGESYVFLANVLPHKADGTNWTKWFNISATTNSVIYEMTYNGNYIA